MDVSSVPAAALISRMRRHLNNRPKKPTDLSFSNNARKLSEVEMTIIHSR
jgi:hypothetical protein